MKRYVAVQGVLALALVLSPLWPGTTGSRALASSSLQTLAAALASVVILRHADRVERTRRTWRRAGLAAALWAAGQAWLTGQLALTGTLVRPSPADAMFVLSVVLAVAAALAFPSLPQERRRRWRFAIDGAVLAGSVAFLVLSRLHPLLASGSSWLALAYPVADCLVITVLLIAAMRAPRPLMASLGTAVLGLLVLSVTNLEVFRLGLEGVPVLDHPMNAGFALGLALVGLGSMRQTEADAAGLAQTAMRLTDGPLERVQRLVPYALVPVVLVVVAASGTAPSGLLLQLLVGLAALLLLRQVLVVEENASLAADVVRRARRYEALVEGSSELVLVVDRQGAVSYASPSVTAALEVPPRPWNLFEAVHPDDRYLLRVVLHEARQQAGVACRVRVPSANRELLLEVRAADRTDDPAVAGLVVNARDVTQEAAAQASLADSERRYRRIVETATEGIWLNDIDGITRFINARAAEMIGLPLEGLIGRPTLEILAEVMTPEQMEQMHQRVAERRAGLSASYDFSMTRPDGRTVHAHISASPLFDAQGRVEGALTMITDITARVEAEEQLRRDARTDALTGLANRTALASRIAAAMESYDPTRPPAVVYCDLDGFKAINDAWGHGAGDDLLRKVAQRLETFAADGTTISRLGGDEFAILLDSTTETEVEQVAQEVMRNLRAPYSLGGRDHHIDLSVGIAVATSTDDVESLLRNADLAMYQAKNDGRGRFRRYERAMHATAAARLRLEQDLRQAMARDELLLHYQPVVSLATGQCVGAEALIRWNHPVLGMVAPDRFIPLAEGSDLILGIGRWVLEKAMTDAESWDRLGPRMVLSVNVAPQQLMDQQHVLDLEEMLRSSALPADQVILEVTERSLLAGERPRHALRTLRATGARLALDDFGTGYSSIAHLRDHPVDVLKLDRSYVTQVTARSANRSLAMAIVNMSAQLGISCTAEGIETEEQASVLASAGCAHAQGYLYAKPMPHDELVQWVLTRASSGVPAPRDGRTTRTPR